MSESAFMEKTWSNADNQTFYNQVDLKRYASVKGLAGGTDVMLAQRFIPSENAAILEIGAGDGRVLEVLLENGYKNVAALEYSRQIEMLPLKFATHLKSGALRLCKGNLSTFRTERRFDTILWLFAGLTDFSITEQAAIFRTLSRCLKPNGKLVVDLPIENQSDLSKGRNLYMNFGNAKRSRYLPSMTQLVRNGASANLRLAEGVPYITETSMGRTLFVYTKTATRTSSNSV